MIGSIDSVGLDIKVKLELMPGQPTIKGMCEIIIVQFILHDLI